MYQNVQILNALYQVINLVGMLILNKQKLTAEPTVDKDRVYFPIYEPSGANSF